MAATNLEKGFQETLKRFQARLTSQERDSFQLVTLQDLKQTILQIQAKQAARSKAMNLPRILGFLEAFEQWGRIVDVFLNASQFVAFVWGPMKFLLQISSNFAHAFDTLLGAYEQIGESLPLFEQYRSLFTGNSHMDEALTKVYEDILEFHRRALRFFTLPTWQQIFRSVWKDFNARFEKILEDLRRHKMLIESQASLLHYQKYQMDRQMFFDQLDRIEIAERKKQYLDLLQWLAGADTLLDHQDICKVRHEYPRSGTWLLSNATYAGWRRDSVPVRSVLWLNGIPGAGKTVLASLVVEDCQKDLHALTIFFYCKHGDPARTTSISILRTLLGELLTSDHDLIPWLYDQYLLSGQLNLSSEALCRDLLKAILQSTPKVYVIIDGLDECDRQHRKSLLSAFCEILTLCDNQDPGKLRLIVVSQNENDIGRGMALYSEITIKITDNADDIEHFVKAWCVRIQAKFELSDAEKDSIAEISCQRADGMFLFVKLVMQNLFEQVNLDGLQDQVRPDRFPKGIEQAYQRILDRIHQRPPQEQQLAQTILGWMTCARRQLRWYEIQGAFAVNTQSADVAFHERRPKVHIREICGPLVNELPGDRLELVHYTAKHYLIDSTFIRRSVVECRLTTVCLRYLASDCFDPDLSVEDRRSCLLNGDFVFQDYAAVHWSDHLLSVIRTGPDLLQSEFLKMQDEFSSAITDFTAQYDLMDPSPTGLQSEADLENFRKFEFWDDLSYLYRHIQRQSAKGEPGLDSISPEALKRMVTINRKILETIPQSTTMDSNMKNTLVFCYGSKWYKCPRAACFYFHEGFEDSTSRETHILRHEMPFRCIYQECETGYKLGFTKRKDLDKHMLHYHPEIGQGDKGFLRPNKARSKDQSDQSPGRTKHPAIHECDICDKRFTRANILKHHKLSHKDEKPYKCEVCNSGFVRDSDRKRHERIHRKEHTCGGRLQFSIPPKDWGCGKKFARADALANHHRTAVGKACLAPLLEERKLEQERLSVFTEGNLPVPEAILKRHPEFRPMSYGQLINRSLNDPSFNSNTPDRNDSTTSAEERTYSIEEENSFLDSSASYSYDTGFLTPVPQLNGSITPQSDMITLSPFLRSEQSGSRGALSEASLEDADQHEQDFGPEMDIA